MTVKELIIKTDQWSRLAGRLESELEEHGTENCIRISPTDVDMAAEAINLLVNLIYKTDVNIHGLERASWLPN